MSAVARAKPHYAKNRARGRAAKAIDVSPTTLPDEPAPKARPIPSRARLIAALAELRTRRISPEDLMAYWLVCFEKTEVVISMRKQGYDITTAQWLEAVRDDGDYPVAVGYDLFNLAIAMSERFEP